jgi:CARDB
VTVRNDGDGDATEVDVSVQKDGATLDHAVLHRIAPGGSAQATLSGPGSATPVQVVVDGASRYPTDPRSQLVVSGAARTVGAPILPVALGVLVVAAWARRRH